jgi:hypothetical protein
LRARPALGVSVGEQQSHYCDTEQNKTDRAHGSSPSPSFRAANAKGDAASPPSKPMNSRRCTSTTPLKHYAEYSRSAPCFAVAFAHAMTALGHPRLRRSNYNTVHVRFALKSERTVIIEIGPGLA